MEDIDRTMAGKVSDKAIWDLQANLYAKHVTEPLARQGIKAPVVTPDDCRALLAAPGQPEAHHRRGHQIHQHHAEAVPPQPDSVAQHAHGRDQDEQAAVRQWTALSKHKLDLIKYYNNTLSKDDGKGTTTSTPYTFT